MKGETSIQSEDYIVTDKEKSKNKKIAFHFKKIELINEIKSRIQNIYNNNEPEEILVYGLAIYFFENENKIKKGIIYINEKEENSLTFLDLKSKQITKIQLSKLADINFGKNSGNFKVNENKIKKIEENKCLTMHMKDKKKFFDLIFNTKVDLDLFCLGIADALEKNINEAKNLKRDIISLKQIWKQYVSDQDKKHLNFQQFSKFLRTICFKWKKKTDEQIFKEIDEKKQGKINFKDFISFYEFLVTGEEFREIFQKYSSDEEKKYITIRGLMDFMEKEQHMKVSMQDIFMILHKFSKKGRKILESAGLINNNKDAVIDAVDYVHINNLNENNENNENINNQKLTETNLLNVEPINLNLGVATLNHENQHEDNKLQNPEFENNLIIEKEEIDNKIHENNLINFNNGNEKILSENNLIQFSNLNFRDKEKNEINYNNMNNFSPQQKYLNKNNINLQHKGLNSNLNNNNLNGNTKSNMDHESLQAIYDNYSFGRNNLLDEIKEGRNEDIYSAFCLSFREFVNFLIDRSYNTIFNHDLFPLHQNMNLPINDYFIYSSHNTYLVGNQMIGNSSIDMYNNCLKNGCRLVELDCWDGKSGPIITHWHFPVNKLDLKEVLINIKDYAFKKSPYPVIFSIENHCNNTSQEMMAQYFLDVIGKENLYIIDTENPPLAYPSPNDLQRKFIIKCKRKRILGKKEKIKKLLESNNGNFNFTITTANNNLGKNSNGQINNFNNLNNNTINNQNFNNFNFNNNGNNILNTNIQQNENNSYFFNFEGESVNINQNNCNLNYKLEKKNFGNFSIQQNNNNKLQIENTDINNANEDYELNTDYQILNYNSGFNFNNNNSNNNLISSAKKSNNNNNNFYNTENANTNNLNPNSDKVVSYNYTIEENKKNIINRMVQKEEIIEEVNSINSLKNTSNYEWEFENLYDSCNENIDISTERYYTRESALISCINESKKLNRKNFYSEKLQNIYKKKKIHNPIAKIIKNESFDNLQNNKKINQLEKPSILNNNEQSVFNNKIHSFIENNKLDVNSYIELDEEIDDNVNLNKNLNSVFKIKNKKRLEIFEVINEKNNKITLYENNLKLSSIGEDLTAMNKNLSLSSTDFTSKKNYIRKRLDFDNLNELKNNKNQNRNINIETHSFVNKKYSNKHHHSKIYHINLFKDLSWEDKFKIANKEIKEVLKNREKDNIKNENEENKNELKDFKPILKTDFHEELIKTNNNYEEVKSNFQENNQKMILTVRKSSNKNNQPYIQQIEKGNLRNITHTGILNNNNGEDYAEDLGVINENINTQNDKMKVKIKYLQENEELKFKNLNIEIKDPPLNTNNLDNENNLNGNSHSNYYEVYKIKTKKKDKKKTIVNLSLESEISDPLNEMQICQPTNSNKVFKKLKVKYLINDNNLANNINNIPQNNINGIAQTNTINSNNYYLNNNNNQTNFENINIKPEGESNLNFQTITINNNNTNNNDFEVLTRMHEIRTIDELKPSTIKIKTIDKLAAIVGMIGVKYKQSDFDNGLYLPWECVSISEPDFNKYIINIEERLKLIKFCQKSFIKTYPDVVKRTNSSNHDPIVSWASGVQIAALNLQKTDDDMILINKIFFKLNGGSKSGYILKPEVLRNPNCDDLVRKMCSKVAFKIKFKVLSGFHLHLCFPEKTKITGLFVEVSLRSAYNENENKKLITNMIENNYLHPIWVSSSVHFEIYDPDLSFIMIKVFSKKKTVIARSVIPVKFMNLGIRVVDLYDNYCSRFENSFLIVKCNKILMGEK